MDIQIGKKEIFEDIILSKKAIKICLENGLYENVRDVLDAVEQLRVLDNQLVEAVNYFKEIEEKETEGKPEVEETPSIEETIPC